MIHKNDFYTILRHKQAIGEWVKPNIAFIQTDSTQFDDYRLWDVVDREGKEVKPYTKKDWEQACEEIKGYIEPQDIISILESNFASLPFKQDLAIVSVLTVLRRKWDYITSDDCDDIISYLQGSGIDTASLEECIKGLNPKWSK